MQPAAPAPQYPHSSMQIAKLSASVASPTNDDPVIYPSLASTDHSHPQGSSDVSTSYSHQSLHRSWDTNISINHNDNISGSLFNDAPPSLSMSRVPDLSPGSSTDHSSVRTPLDMYSMPPPLQDMYTGKIVSENDWPHYKPVTSGDDTIAGSRPHLVASMSATTSGSSPTPRHGQQSHSAISARSSYSSHPPQSSSSQFQQQSMYAPHSSETRYPFVSTSSSSTPTRNHMHTQPQLHAQSRPQIHTPPHPTPSANSASNSPEAQAQPHSQLYPPQTYEPKQKPERPRLLIEQPVSFASVGQSKSQQMSPMVQQPLQSQYQVGAPMHSGQQQQISTSVYPQPQHESHSRRPSWNPDLAPPTSASSSLSHIIASSTVNPSSNMASAQQQQQQQIQQRWIQQMHLEQQQQAMRQAQSQHQKNSAAHYSESGSWIPRPDTTIGGSVNGNNGQGLTVNANLNIALNLGNGIHTYSHLPSQSQQLPPLSSTSQTYSTTGGEVGSWQSYGPGQHADMVPQQQQRMASQPQYFVSQQQLGQQQRRLVYVPHVAPPQQQPQQQQQRSEPPSQMFSYNVDSVPPPQQASYGTSYQSMSTFMPMHSNHQQTLPHSNWGPSSAPPPAYPHAPPSSGITRRHSQYTIEPPSTASSRKRSPSPMTETTALSQGGMVSAAESVKRRKYSPPASLNPALGAVRSTVAPEDAHARLVSWRQQASAATATPREEPVQTRSSGSVSTRASSSTKEAKPAKGRDANDESDEDAEGEDESKDEDEEDASDYIDDGDDEEYDPHESKSRKTASRSRRGRPPGSTKKSSTRPARATRSTSQAVPASPTSSRPATKGAPTRRGRQARGS